MPTMLILIFGVLGLTLVGGSIVAAVGLRHAPLGEETEDGFRTIRELPACASERPEAHGSRPALG
ncbi:MAG TPA: hypothetical protein VHE61_09750 [Opitutaceae bacterium]|nr:hypothetical protein [Opitutaceae bacterium]